MHHVSNTFVKLTAESIATLYNVPISSLFENAPLTKADLERKNRWANWDSFVDWLDWIDTRSFGPVDWAEVGRHSPRGPSFALANTLIRSSVSVRFGYHIAAKWLGESLIPVINSQVEYVGKNHVKETLVLIDSVRPFPKLFILFSGSLALLLVIPTLQLDNFYPVITKD